jgi:hypothetical protein
MTTSYVATVKGGPILRWAAAYMTVWYVLGVNSIEFSTRSTEVQLRIQHYMEWGGIGIVVA